jgi:hypothetical protein
MGPSCPECQAIYEWTAGELEELVTGPKVYFCGECRALFVLSPEEATSLQERLRPPAPLDLDALEEVADEQLELGFPEDEGICDAVEAPPRLELRHRVLVTKGPHVGTVGAVAVIDGDVVVLRVDGGSDRLRVSSDEVSRVWA